ncbi:MAG: hypothetical protein K2K52_00270, partial [Paramuribaculum sp.]|nr:hypothetical protein [Paramuribaculum sp.]
MSVKRIAFISLALFVGAVASAQIASPVVKADFAERQKTVGNKEYFSVFDKKLTPEQRQALEVLYAYMPLPDMADNSGDFFLENVDYSLKARKEMPWGSKVPDRE